MTETKTLIDSRIEKQYIEDYQPFLGRLLIEAIEEDVDGYLRELYGMAKDSKLVLSDNLITGYKVPVTKGKIIKISDNSFGESFKRRYGEDMAKEGKKLKPGDIVWFVHNQAYQLDPRSKYLQLNDEQILGYKSNE